MAKTERRVVITKYQGDASSLTKTLKSIDKSASQTAKGMAKVNRTLRQAQAVFSAVGFGVGFVAAARSVKRFVDEVARVEVLDTQLRGVTNSTEDFARSLEFVRETADKYGLSQQVLLQNYSKFIAAGQGAGFGLNELEQQFTSVATAAAAFGLTATEVDAVILGWQQTLGNAVVNMEDLRQVVDRLPGGLNLAVAAFNDVNEGADIASKEFKKLVADGKVLTEDFLPALSRQLQETFTEGAIKGADTYRAAVNRLSNSFTDLKRAVVDAGLLDFMGGLVSGAADAVDVLRLMNTENMSMAEAYAQLDLVEAIDGLGQYRDNLGSATDKLKDIKAELDRVSTAYTVNEDHVKALSTAMDNQQKVVDALTDAYKVAQEEFVDARAETKALEAANNATTGSLYAMGDAAKSTAEDLRNVQSALQDAASTQEQINSILAPGGGTYEVSKEADLGDVALNMHDIAASLSEGNFDEAQREIDASANALQRLSESANSFGVSNLTSQLSSFQQELTKTLQQTETALAGGTAEKNPLIEEMKAARSYAEDNPIKWAVSLDITDALEGVADQTGYRE